MPDRLYQENVWVFLVTHDASIPRFSLRGTARFAAWVVTAPAGLFLWLVVTAWLLVHEAAVSAAPTGALAAAVTAASETRITCMSFRLR
ncbi:hypothetical protein [Streptomyces chrestomyceticus]|uniref:hypothetical protein n=1 Tax=Streptomyces chrestomyceticus TaxID=68185 RepID=UPI0004C7E48C